MSAAIKIPLLDLAPAIAELRPALDAAYARVMDSGWVLLGKELAAGTPAEIRSHKEVVSAYLGA